MTLDTPDAQAFHGAVTIIAAELAAFGDTDPLDVRRARAVGILADPQYAIDLLHGLEGTPTHGGTGALDFYLHLTPADLTGEGAGAVSIEKLGAATTHLLADWLARHGAVGGKVNLRPVLDLSEDRAVDQHDPPPAMREQVLLRDAHCVFPGCRRDSRSCDLDHITPYIAMEDGGPPGQTRPTNLAPLCRTHHRIKTHTTWDYKRLDGGSYTWTAPTGHQYDVTPTSRRPPATRPKNLTPHTPATTPGRGHRHAHPATTHHRNGHTNPKPATVTTTVEPSGRWAGRRGRGTPPQPHTDADHPNRQLRCTIEPEWFRQAQPADRPPRSVTGNASSTPATATTTAERGGGEPDEGVGEHHRNHPPTSTTPIDNSGAPPSRSGFDKLIQRGARWALSLAQAWFRRARPGRESPLD